MRLFLSERLDRPWPLHRGRSGSSDSNANRFSVPLLEADPHWRAQVGGRGFRREERRVWGAPPRRSSERRGGCHGPRSLSPRELRRRLEASRGSRHRSQSPAAKRSAGAIPRRLCERPSVVIRGGRVGQERQRPEAGRPGGRTIRGALSRAYSSQVRVIAEAMPLESSRVSSIVWPQ